MKITADHVRAFGYWRTPPAILAHAPKMARPCIDSLINAHAGIRVDTELHNALHLVALRRKNGDTCLAAIGLSNWDRVNAPRRWHMFRRWQRKLAASQGRVFLPFQYPPIYRSR